MVEDLVVLENTTASIIKVDANLKTHTHKNTILKKLLVRRQLYDEESIWQVQKLGVSEKFLEKDWGRLKLNSAKYTRRARFDGHAPREEQRKFEPSLTLRIVSNFRSYFSVKQ